MSALPDSTDSTIDNNMSSDSKECLLAQAKQSPEQDPSSQQSQATERYSSPIESQRMIWGHLLSDDKSLGTLFELSEKTTTIGRAEHCDISLPVPQMSSHHCTIHYSEERNIAKLQDTSTNGTWVNKKRISKQQCLLSDGDDVMFVPGSKKRKRKKISFLVKLCENPIRDVSEFRSHYKVMKSLGSGAFAEVKLVRKRIISDVDSTDTSNETLEFAMKEINKAQWERVEQATVRSVTLLDEVKIMEKVGKHENIVSVIEYFEEPDNVYVVMDYCDGGDMLDHIQKHGGYTNEEARSLFQQMTSAMDYLHNELSIAHRDLKPDNILLSGKDSKHLKISDFGISRESTQSMNCKTIIGTPLYQAPEVHLNHDEHKNGYDGKLADIWSMGIILYIMLVAAPPANEPSDIVELADKCALPWWEDNVVETAKDLIYRMLKVNPGQRIHSKDVLKHPWMLGFDTIAEYEQSLGNAGKRNKNGNKNKNSHNGNNDRKDDGSGKGHNGRDNEDNNDDFKYGWNGNEHNSNNDNSNSSNNGGNTNRNSNYNSSYKNGNDGNGNDNDNGNGRQFNANPNGNASKRCVVKSYSWSHGFGGSSFSPTSQSVSQSPTSLDSDDNENNNENGTRTGNVSENPNDNSKEKSTSLGLNTTNSSMKSAIEDLNQRLSKSQLSSQENSLELIDCDGDSVSVNDDTIEENNSIKSNCNGTDLSIKTGNENINENNNDKGNTSNNSNEDDDVEDDDLFFSTLQSLNPKPNKTLKRKCLTPNKRNSDKNTFGDNQDDHDTLDLSEPPPKKRQRTVVAK